METYPASDPPLQCLSLMKRGADLEPWQGTRQAEIQVIHPTPLQGIVPPW